VQRGPAEYDLFLRADLHTDAHMQVTRRRRRVIRAATAEL
jgi:hypothetical protein